MILPGDTLKFTVSFIKDGELQTITFDTFAGAAGAASALTGITRMLSVRATNPDNSSAWSATMYSYDRKTNERRVCSKTAVNAVTQVGAL